jgi:hypothetical protein
MRFNKRNIDDLKSDSFLNRPHGFGTPQSGRNSVPIILFGLFVTATTALFAPTDVLSQFKYLDAYVKYVGAVILSIDAMAEVSLFPQVTRLVLSCAWTVALIQTLLMYWRRTIMFDLEYARQRKYIFTFLLMIALLAVLTLARFQYIDPADLLGNTLSNSVLRAMSTSRLALGFVSGCLAIFVAASLAMFIECGRRISEIYFNRGKGKSQ